MLNKNCSICDTEFTCGAKQEDQTCWCTAVPAIMPTEFTQDCRCQSCLTQAIAKRIDESIKLNGHEQMLEIASQYRKQSGLIEHIDYTIENGNYVFSMWYHLKRGACCGNDCRNCPYSA
ncbi:MAG: hypothetical protein IIC63_04075 [Proteobacteria bacterium]|nr:hypothetical protein [Pseudomonadota bacterium]